MRENFIAEARMNLAQSGGLIIITVPPGRTATPGELDLELRANSSGYTLIWMPDVLSNTDNLETVY
jgi:hypothetical protein